ncbi:MAG: A/G-specific adenine glycosylase [Chlamydiales bacterium]|nr:A/G-specific adenine glycosylase [Chlamydiia bacterium]MCP5507374.1 A/G-specific adenine glycosylase [Chlamydiales bacterium]
MEVEKLRQWFLEERRDLPWRGSPSPYAVWVSEVMLQQTQVAVVIPYFERWMERFPSVEALAAASVDEVIKVWEGLGYYSRARNLHAGARQVIEQFDGKIPEDAESLGSIKGLGHYTVGAIRSFAFRRRAAAVDGNVIRVLARYYRIDDDIAKTATVNRMRVIAEEILPEKRPWEVSEALIELGAKVCGRKPLCRECPLRGSCQAYAHGQAEQLPVKSKSIKTLYLHRAVVVIVAEGELLLRRGQEGDIMHDLHEFPYFDAEEGGLCAEVVEARIMEAWDLEVANPILLPTQKHTFTRYRVTLYPVRFDCGVRKDVDGYGWFPLASVGKLAFSSGHRRVLRSLLAS